jgi:hypothetical protein
MYCKRTFRLSYLELSVVTAAALLSPLIGKVLEEVAVSARLGLVLHADRQASASLERRVASPVGKALPAAPADRWNWNFRSHQWLAI